MFLRRLSFALALLFPVAGEAEPKACETSTVSVESDNDTLVETVCKTAEQARLMLNACHLSLQEDILVVVSGLLPGVSPRIIGIYESAENRISVLSPEELQSALLFGSAFAGIEKNIFFKSVLIHELSHAAFENTACRSGSCVENHEYVAYAMQMLSLPVPYRQKIVNEYRITPPIDPLLLNSFIAVMAPDRFAAIVWQHFSEEGNGCSFVRDLASGKSTLGLVSQR